MATAPTAPADPEDASDTGPDSTMGPDDDSDQMAELCIGVGTDGSLTVYMEQQDQQTTPKPAASIGDALKMVLDMYKQLDVAGGQSQFDAGYSGASSGSSATSQSGAGGM